MSLGNITKPGLERKILIINLTLFLIVGAIVIFAIIPSIKNIKEMRKEIEGQKIDLEEKYQRGQSLKKLSENLKKIEPQLEKLNLVFISKNRELEFITTLEDIASREKIEQKINLASGQSGGDGAYQKMPLQLFTQGTFKNQMNYLLALETLNYYINIKNLELSAAPLPPGAAKQDVNISMMITADTYWK